MKKIFLFISLVILLNLTANCQEKTSYFKVGKTYVLYSYKSKNPFEKQTKATVKITRIKDGYIEYCWHYEYKNKNRVTFSRTCEEFIELINNRPKQKICH